MATSILETLEERVRANEVAIAEIRGVQSGLATKADVERLHGEVMAAVESVRGEVMSAVENVRGEMMSAVENVRGDVMSAVENVRGEVQRAKAETIKWMVGTMIASAGVGAAFALAVDRIAG